MKNKKRRNNVVFIVVIFGAIVVSYGAPTFHGTQLRTTYNLKKLTKPQQ